MRAYLVSYPVIHTYLALMLFVNTLLINFSGHVRFIEINSINDKRLVPLVRKTNTNKYPTSRAPTRAENFSILMNNIKFLMIVWKFFPSKISIQSVDVKDAFGLITRW